MADLNWIMEQEAKIPRGGVRTRFAPSPTGYMHVGNLRTALYTWLIARHAGGTFILRIEDTDQNRQVEGAVDVIYKTLAECGLDHDEGPDVGGPVAPYIQTERRGFYQKYAEWLVERGHAYYCFCDRADSVEEGAFSETPPTDPCRALTPEEADARRAAGEPYVIRQRIPREGTTTFHDEVFGDITVENATLDDQVLLKQDGLPTYNFANVVDDHMMGITHVVRGSEYLSSAPKYNLLYEGFGWPIPRYVHCPAVMRDQHNKMSKRHGDPSYEDLIAQGYLTDAVVNYVVLLGWSPRGEIAEQEIFSREELISAFDLGGISKSPAIFDMEKLRHFNSAYIRAMPPERFAVVAEPYIRQAVKNPAYDAGALAALLQQRTEVLTEIPEKLDFFDALPDYDVALFVHKKSRTDLPGSLETLRALAPRFAALPSWDADALSQTMCDYASECGCKNAKIMWPVRIALSGKAVTPGGAVEIAHILGQEESLSRIARGIEKLEGAQ
ncbi:MAG: glutamate--tRNA ligase [Oscillospiraceae bacterium]|nr:glutamate--tRNA ligase [Oscillospiraceae bacterium]